MTTFIDTNDAPGLKQVPVTILTGFLGSGKTTLLNYILTQKHGLRIAVIENEFGEIDVDSDLVLSSEEEIFQMTNGCICCVIDVRSDLVEILQKLLARSDRFDYILLETSGLADPTPVAATFFMDNDVARQVYLDGIVTLVDAVHIETHLDDPQLAGMDNQAVDQLIAADRILINKTDLATHDAVTRLAQRLRRINEGAQILTCSHAKLDLAAILGIGGFAASSPVLSDPSFLEEPAHVCDGSCDGNEGHGGDHGGHAHGGDGHMHDPSVESVSLVFDAPFDLGKLTGYLDDLVTVHGDDLFRLKGIIAIDGDDRRYVLQGVHRLLEMKPADAWAGMARSSKFVFIGRKLQRDELNAGLQRCASTLQVGARGTLVDD